MEMTYDGALVMPKNFVSVDEEEMTYVDGGGFSMDLFRRNVVGGVQKAIANYKGPILAQCGITLAAVKGWCAYSYAWLCANIGWKVVRIASIVGGIVAGIVAAASCAVAVYIMGTRKVFC